MKKQLREPVFIITLAIVAFFVLTNISAVWNGAVWFLGLFTPFWIGGVIALCLNRPYNWFEKKVFGKMTRSEKKSTRNLGNVFSLLAVYILFLATILLMFFLVIPELFKSVERLIPNLPGYAADLETTLNGWLDRFDVRSEVWDKLETYWNDLIDHLGDTLSISMPKVVSAVSGAAGTVTSLIIGLVASVYILADKDRLKADVRRMTRALFPEDLHSFTDGLLSLINRIFSQFVIGQLFNALLVGVVCCIGMLILNIDYPWLISPLMAVANLIPYFGGIIGAVPSVLLLLMLDPVKALWFAIFITAVQILDGNIISPKIVGNTLGISGLWVIISISIGGSFFGLPGVFLAVPFFAVIYSLVRDYTLAHERKKAAEKQEAELTRGEDANARQENALSSEENE